MRVTRRTLLGVVAGTASLAGCTGGEGGSGGGQPTDGAPGSPTPTEMQTPVDGGSTPTAAPATTTGGGSSGPTVGVADHPDLGEVLVGPDGLTLYMFDRDTRGEAASACYDSCAEAWPPLETEGEPTVGEGVTAALTTFERDTGETQVAAGGWPLYYFASDESPGDASGQGVGDVWWVLRPDGTPVRPEGTETLEETATPTPTATPGPTVRVREHPEHGDILVGPRGMTLYAFDSDDRGDRTSACYDACAEAWPPLTVAANPTAADAISATVRVFERETGERQVTADGWPLYYYYRDENPGDALGHGVGAAWWVVRPDGTPIRPDGSSDGGSGY